MNNVPRHKGSHFIMPSGKHDVPDQPMHPQPLWVSAWQTLQNGMCAQRRLRPAWASAATLGQRMTKPTKWHVRPAKTQTSLCIRSHFGPAHDKTYKMVRAPSEESDQTGHPPSLIRVFVVRMKKVWFLSDPLGAQRRLRSVWAEAQADLSLRWAHMPLSWFCHVLASFNSIEYKLHTANILIRPVVAECACYSVSCVAGRLPKVLTTRWEKHTFTHTRTTKTTISLRISLHVSIVRW